MSFGIKLIIVNNINSSLLAINHLKEDRLDIAKSCFEQHVSFNLKKLVIMYSEVFMIEYEMRVDGAPILQHPYI